LMGITRYLRSMHMKKMIRIILRQNCLYRIILSAQKDAIYTANLKHCIRKTKNRITSITQIKRATPLLLEQMLNSACVPAALLKFTWSVSVPTFVFFIPPSMPITKDLTRSEEHTSEL